MACSYRGLTASGEIRPDASCRIASTSSGGLGMLPIGSVGIGMRAILSASRPLSNGRRVWVGSADHWMGECVLYRLAGTGGGRDSGAHTPGSQGTTGQTLGPTPTHHRY